MKATCHTLCWGKHVQEETRHDSAPCKQSQTPAWLAKCHMNSCPRRSLSRSQNGKYTEIINSKQLYLVGWLLQPGNEMKEVHCSSTVSVIWRNTVIQTPINISIWPGCIGSSMQSMDGLFPLPMALSISSLDRYAPPFFTLMPVFM